MQPLGAARPPSLRRSDYDLDRAVERIRATGYPDAEDVAQILLQPPDPERVATFFERQALATETNSQEYPTSDVLRTPLLRTGSNASKRPITPVRPVTIAINRLDKPKNRPVARRSRS